LADSLKVAIMLQQGGVDAIELSAGTVFSGDLGPVRGGINTERQEAYFIPLMLVGGIRSFQIAQQLVVEGCADHISMSRPFIREPALVNRWASGDLRKAACLSDDRCREPAMTGEGIYCVVEKQLTRIIHDQNYQV
jgi:2,4-dienoyl-CoA reductase-like NADH-dependent reductase (Old Yellow Enzyme family)